MTQRRTLLAVVTLGCFPLEVVIADVFFVLMLQSENFFGYILDHRQGKTKTAVFSLLEDSTQRSINKKRQSVLSDDQWMTSG